MRRSVKTIPCGESGPLQAALIWSVRKQPSTVDGPEAVMSRKPSTADSPRGPKPSTVDGCGRAMRRAPSSIQRRRTTQQQHLPSSHPPRGNANLLMPNDPRPIINRKHQIKLNTMKEFSKSKRNFHPTCILLQWWCWDRSQKVHQVFSKENC